MKITALECNRNCLLIPVIHDEFLNRIDLFRQHVLRGVIQIEYNAGG
jgi:hypothetical protein